MFSKDIVRMGYFLSIYVLPRKCQQLFFLEADSKLIFISKNE